MLGYIRFGQSESYEVELPMRCPHCNEGGQPVQKEATISIMKNKNYMMGVIFMCTICEKLYFANYSCKENAPFALENIYPFAQPKILIPIEIKDYYPEFYEIYEQSAKAEIYGLNHISGMGYRKAVEFLVKGYLIKIYPAEKDSIEKEPLSQSIKRIDCIPIKNLSTAATWLGNDHVHFLQKHKDYSIKHIKRFIAAMCYKIMMEEITLNEATELINSPKPQKTSC